jgi:predicted GIY-YIG superfamily endonuclease
MPAANAPGTIYLLHYTVRTKRGRQHYLGWSDNPIERLRRHRSGRGATETKRAIAEGAKLVMAQTWHGTPALERKLKDWSRSRRAGFAGICPMCEGGTALPAELEAALGRGSMQRVYNSANV